MRKLTNMKVVLCLFVFAAVPPVVSAQERARGLYIDVGFGFGGIRYLGGDIKTIVDGFNKSADTQFTLDLTMLTIGGALRDTVYLVGTIAGVGDAYFDSEDNHNQITTAMYGLGIRYYPLPSKKHLQLGLGLGASGIQTTYDRKSDAPDTSEDTSDIGFSERVSIGWDFDSTMTGLTAMIGGNVMLNIIEGETSVSYALFLKILFK
jgi:hypothetical protein